MAVLTRDEAKELLGCFFVKFNNHPAPPKVGVTAAESGTYTDFANINVGGLTRDGEDAVNEVSYLLLEVIDEMHLLQPSNNLQLSAKNPDRFLRAGLEVIRKGYGFPSVFNADAVVKELVRQGKTVEDAREGGTSGCVEAGAFGKEAYILTGYFNLPKLLELVLNNGVDPRTGKQLGPKTGDPAGFSTFDELFAAWRTQVDHFVEIKYRGNAIWERAYAEDAPAPFLSLIIDDCIATGRDYNAGGARYNTSYIQGVGIGSITDSLSAIKHHVFDDGTVSLADLREALADDFEDHEPLRQQLVNRTPRYGNDDDRADEIMVRCFEAFFEAVDGRPNGRGGEYHIDMLPTTCHVYFGSVIGAMPDGRRAGLPLSEGISPVQGADRNGPRRSSNRPPRWTTCEPAAPCSTRSSPRSSSRANRGSTSSPVSSAATSGWIPTTFSSTWSPPRLCVRRRPTLSPTAISSSGSPATATTSAISRANSRTRSSRGPSTRASSCTERRRAACGDRAALAATDVRCKSEEIELNGRGAGG